MNWRKQLTPFGGKDVDHPWFLSTVQCRTSQPNAAAVYWLSLGTSLMLAQSEKPTQEEETTEPEIKQLTMCTCLFSVSLIFLSAIRLFCHPSGSATVLVLSLGEVQGCPLCRGRTVSAGYWLHGGS